MKKILLALLVLTISAPAMAVVKVRTKRGPNDLPNKSQVIISYENTASEKTRAYAIDVAVNKDACVKGSAFRPDPNYYYVTPTNILFAVTGGGVTYISNKGSPVVPKADANDGFILEVASLYAAGDVNHPSAPPASGDLVKFYVDCSKVGASGTVDVTVKTDAQRGGIVLEDGNSVTVTLNPSTFTAPKLSFCKETHPCWLGSGQPSGDCTGDGNVGTSDYFAFKKTYGTNSASYPHGTGVGQYNCCCDFNHDLSVGTADYFIFKQNYGRTGMVTYANKTCP